MRAVLLALALAASAAAAASTSPTPARLALCDCEWAEGGPGSLSCAKEGFIVTGFERTGRWAAGGGDVPLSRARCCRPCLPGDDDDDDAKGGDDAQPLAVLSLDCHAPGSDGGGADALLCESNTGGFVAGFADARRVGGGGGGKAGSFYPTGRPRCCTPALLAPSGDTSELGRCDCVTVPGVSCDAGDTKDNATSTRALRGFRSWRVAPNGDVLPVGPVECCGVCASGSDDPARDCGGGCSGRGACVLGACVCEPGWRGPACGLRAGNVLADAIQALAGVVAVAIVCAVGALAARAARRAAAADAADDDGDDDGPRAAARRLLSEADGGAGSVGSADTESENEGGDLEEGACKSPPPSPPSPAAATPSDADEKGSPPAAPDAGAAAVAGATCVVCADRSVQVVLVPCGHACTCRRCARRIVRCPVCRADTARRQRLWVGG